MLGDAANTSSYGISHDRRARVTHDGREDMLVLDSYFLIVFCMNHIWNTLNLLNHST